MIALTLWEQRSTETLFGPNHSIKGKNKTCFKNEKQINENKNPKSKQQKYKKINCFMNMDIART